MSLLLVLNVWVGQGFMEADQPTNLTFHHATDVVQRDIVRCIPASGVEFLLVFVLDWSSPRTRGLGFTHSFK